jgi:AraC family transcriptional regulator, arabinose operon regulatory protein
MNEKPIPSFAQNLPDFATPPESYSPPPGVLLAGYFEELEGYATRRRAGTRDHLIFFTVGGHGRIRLGGHEVMTSAGDIILFAPGTPHDYAALPLDQPWRFYWSHFVARGAWLEWLKLPEKYPGLASLSIHESSAAARIETAFRRLVQEVNERRAFQEELAENALAEVVLLVARQFYRRASRGVDPRIEMVQEYLEQHYHQPVRLDELASLVALSPWRLSHLFKSDTGRTITEALTLLRLGQAARLLEYSSRTAAEIAHDVGLESAFYFSRLFKRVYGISPHDYRKARRARERISQP